MERAMRCGVMHTSVRRQVRQYPAAVRPAEESGRWQAAGGGPPWHSHKAERPAVENGRAQRRTPGSWRQGGAATPYRRRRTRAGAAGRAAGAARPGLRLGSARGGGAAVAGALRGV